MNNEFNDFVNDYNKIIIFRHIDGDGDALGSQWGLYYYLKDKYPNKEIYAVGDETPGYKDVFEESHKLSDESFKDALAIVVDTANVERISDQRYITCKQIIKIDHHLPVDNYGDINIVDEKRSSCAEIVTELLLSLENKKALSKEVAESLYMGIISDTQGFSTSNVSNKTFSCASYLMESKINPANLSKKLRAIDLDVFKFQAFAMSNIDYHNDKLATLTIKQADLKKYNMEISKIKFLVNVMKSIKDIEVWALFIEQEDGTYSASLRSHNTDINTVAREFDGGGHLFASGVKNLSEEDTKELSKKLNKEIK